MQNGKVNFNIIWTVKKIKSLFKIKDNVKNLSCVIYQGICSCGNSYIDKTMRDATKSLDENKQPNGKLEPFKHLQNNP